MSLKFSIIIPAIKTAFLKKSIESVITQTFLNWELIIVDDNSSENVFNIYEKFSFDKRIKYTRLEKNYGRQDPSLTWNKGLELIEGEFVILLGDDDFLGKNTLEEYYVKIIDHPEIDLLRSRIRLIDEHDVTVLYGASNPEFMTWDEFLYHRFVFHHPLSTNEFCLRTSRLKQLGGWVNMPMAFGSDDLTYLFLAEESGIYSCNNSVVSWRVHSKSISGSSKKLTEKENAIIKIKTECLDFVKRQNPIAYEKVYLINLLERELKKYLSISEKIKRRLINIKNLLSSFKKGFIDV